MVVKHSEQWLVQSKHYAVISLYYVYCSRLYITYNFHLPFKWNQCSILTIHKVFYGFCMFLHTVCSPWNTLTLFLYMNKSYFTFFFFPLELVPGIQAFLFLFMAKMYLYPMFLYWDTFVNCNYWMLEAYIFHLINVLCCLNGMCGNFSDSIPMNIQTK